MSPLTYEAECPACGARLVIVQEADRLVSLCVNL